MQMIPEDLMVSAQDYGYRFDIGQLDKTEKHILAKRIKRGKAVRVKAYWPYLLSGTTLKTCDINLETIPASEAERLY